MIDISTFTKRDAWSRVVVSDCSTNSMEALRQRNAGCASNGLAITHLGSNQRQAMFNSALTLLSSTQIQDYYSGGFGATTRFTGRKRLWSRFAPVFSVRPDWRD